MTDDNSNVLPLKPHPKTGLPKPPRVDVVDQDLVESEQQANSIALTSPVEEEPTLSSSPGNQKTFLILTALAVVVALVAGVAIHLLEVFPGGPAYGWLAVAVAVTVALIQARPKATAVGAQWFSYSKWWIRPYDLKYVGVKPSILGPLLRMADRRGTTITLALRDVQANRVLWDYLHLGIRHSVARGAEINQSTVDALKISGAQTRTSD